jgi:hypothetical protein
MTASAWRPKHAKHGYGIADVRFLHQKWKYQHNFQKNVPLLLSK